MTAILVFIPYPLGFSFLLLLFRLLPVFFPKVAGFLGFKITIVLNILAQQLNFQFMGVDFAALAQAQYNHLYFHLAYPAVDLS
ncbi:MAG TPA: hypothetical protein ENI94_08635 [Gammaproteobacteria bacterium]|nr:hypothetical protein [Gammaproteobacteria bacterium]